MSNNIISINIVFQNLPKIYSTNSAFAVFINGNVITWGCSEHGGDSSYVKDQLKDIKEIYSNQYAFAAINKNRDVITWGVDKCGGNSSHVKDQLINIKKIYTTQSAFAAINNEGNIITWW